MGELGVEQVLEVARAIDERIKQGVKIMMVVHAHVFTQQLPVGSYPDREVGRVNQIVRAGHGVGPFLGLTS